MIGKKQVKRGARIFYYRTLCILLNSRISGSDRLYKFMLKFQMPELISDKNISAVQLLILGEVTRVGFRSWLQRRARLQGLECWTRIKNGNALEAVLVGAGTDIESVIRDAWKGTKKARILKIKENWFNKPITPGMEKSDGEENNQPIPWSQETADRIIGAIEVLAPIMKQPNRFIETGNLSNAGELKRAAENRNLFAVSFSNSSYVVSPLKEIGLQQSQSSRVSSIIRSLSDNKHLLKEFLSKHELPVPKGDVFTEFQKAKKYIKTSHGSLVVKPAAGSYGQGVTVDVRTEKAFVSAWDYAKKFHEQVVVEELIQGVDIRVLVVGGIAKAALLRVPAHVIGNGKETVEDLVHEKNKQRMKNPRLCKAPIVPDGYAEMFLARQGYSLTSIPEKGKVVFLHLKANIGAGADSITITEYIHPDLMRLAEEAVSVLGIEDFWGVDLLVEQIDKPRGQQKCTIIEVNSRANIFNVQVPLYGTPVDTAQALIDHLFPEDTRDHSYPVENKKVKITGFFNQKFYDWTRQQADELDLKVSIQAVGDTLEAVISGHRHHVLSYLGSMWDWQPGDRGMVDGLRVSVYAGTAKDSSTVIKGKDIEKFPQEQIVFSGFNIDESSANRYDLLQYNKLQVPGLDTKLFLDEFKRQGYEAQPSYEELIKISKEKMTGVTGMRHSSLFCDKVCEKIHPVKLLLSIHGLPVPRGVRFKANEMEKALRYFTKLSGPCVVTSLHSERITKQRIDNKDSLRALWEKARKKGTKYVLLEEYVEGWNVCAAVVSGHAVGSMIIEPVGVLGNGKSSTARLIEEKNTRRALNPRYHDKPIVINKRLLKQLEQSGRRIDDIPSVGETVFLETETGLELGGETININEILHNDFKDVAVQAAAAVPGLDFAFIHMIIPRPDQSSENQKWVITGIDTNPSVSLFHFPWKGEPCDLAKKVIAELCLTQRTRWIQER